ncbi:MAG TPA: ABC transporter permease [Roseiflexaceae bacterium]|nr:ABC transporter permease [Roseiflexaceae bacterium]
MALVLNRLALFGVLWRRSFSHLRLLLSVWAGFTLAVALAVSIPVYAEATGYRMLLATFAEQAAQDPLPPFSFIYSYGGASTPSVTWANYRQADLLASDLTSAGIALPTQRTVRYAGTEELRMVFADGAGEEVDWARLAFISDFQNQVRLVMGTWPAPWQGTGPMDVLVSEQAASKLTLLVDDVYQLHAPPGYPVDLNLPIRVAGIWRAADPDSEYWFYSPQVLSGMLLAPETSFARAVDHPTVPWVHYAAWYTALDGTSVRSAGVPRLLDQIGQVTADIQRALPGSELRRSPTEALARQRDQVRVLTITLVLFSVPLIGLLVYFMNQMAGLMVERQKDEIAVLRSRGSSYSQVIALALGEGLAIGVAALLAGTPLSLPIAQALLWTRSFLQFAPLEGPPPTLLTASLGQGALVVALAAPVILLRSLSAAHRTIISAKQERARDTRAPLWQRLGVDLLLLIPALYGYQQLRLHGMIAVPGLAISADDPYRNPVLLLAPALLVLALALLALRIVPRLLALLAWALGGLPGALPTALRFLARTPSAYSGSLLLIMFTLSLAVFGASMARTLDQHSADRARYSAGADVRLAYHITAPAGTTTLVTGAVPSSGSAQASSAAPVATSSPDYLSIPTEEFAQLPGVRAAARAAPSNVYVVAGDGPEERGVFLGVDRLALPEVLMRSWRPDYSPEPLGALMNRLADSPAAALVSSRFAAERELREGDRIILKMNDTGGTQEISFLIAGMIDYFPTMYADSGPFVIGNLDYSFDEQGRPYPYEVWLDLEPGTPLDAIEAAAFGYGLQLRDTPVELMQTDQLRPERQGLFGLLSVGFLAQALLSFQRRMAELGVLRAIGMSTAQLARLLICEQVLVIGIGCAIGTALGVLTSRLFTPFLQVRTGTFPDTPPFVPLIAWDQIGLFYAAAAGLLLCTTGATLALLWRMRLFEALKLGEAT